LVHQSRAVKNQTKEKIEGCPEHQTPDPPAPTQIEWRGVQLSVAAGTRGAAHAEKGWPS